ncbi:hypothetical protein INR49_000628, partial [Caranx melampygus]
MKDSDVSITLKSVTTNDTGASNCRVFHRVMNRRKRATSENEHISIIYLTTQVDGRGDGIEGFQDMICGFCNFLFPETSGRASMELCKNEFRPLIWNKSSPGTK